jgi:hypothetical protein
VADVTPTIEAKPGDAPAPVATVDEPKSYSAEYVKQLRDEAKANREQAKAYEAKLATEATAKANAEKAKLEAEGKWQELAANERKRADDLAAKAAKADEHASELDALKAIELATLPEDMRALVADLPPSKAIALARKLQAQNAGPRAAPAVAGGAPAGSTVPQKPFKDLTPAEQRAALAGKTPAEILALTGVAARKGIYS